MLELILSIAAPIVLGYITYNERCKQKLRQDMNEKMSKDDVKELIDLKLASLYLETRELKEDIQRIERKIDVIIESFLK